MQDQFNSKLDYFRAQLKEFREDDEARWKYEAEEHQRQMRILEGMRRTDEEVKAEFKKAGINVSVLEEEDRKSEKLLEEAHEKLLEIGPPPARRGRKEQIMTQYVDALVGHRQIPSHTLCTWVYPPAFDAWGDTEACGFNLDLGEINTELHAKGSGWSGGIEYSPRYCTLWFYYFPPSSGELLVRPYVDFQGNVAISADDKWYTKTHAKLRLRLHFDLYQHYWDGEQTATIVDEHRHNSSAAYWVDEKPSMSKTLGVSANDIVWIKLTTSLSGGAQSNRARVDCDFRTGTGADRRIKVEGIRVCLSP